MSSSGKIFLKNNEKPLIPIHTDSILDLPDKGPYQDLSSSALNGIYQRDFGKYRERLFIGNGNCLKTYRYPIIQISFKSPLLNDYNLNFCGGWFMPRSDESETLNWEFFYRVIDGKKPIAFIGGDTTTQIQMEKIAKEQGFATSLLFDDKSQRWEFGVGRVERFTTVFDLESLRSDYMKYADYLGVMDEEYLTFYDKIQPLKISDYLQGFDYANEDKNESDNIITGLILGYPVYSTVSTMWYGL